MISEYGKGAVVMAETVFRPVYYVACQVSSETLTVVNEYGKGAVVEIESVFRPVDHLAYRRFL